MTQAASAFSQHLNGKFIGMLHWPQLDELWLKVKAEPQGWYASQPGQVEPAAPLDAEALRHFIDEIDALLRREHKQDFCGIVYADNREQPGFIKIYDPHNMGSFCSCSSTPVEPLWVLSRIKPVSSSNGKPTPWWRSLATLSMVATVVAAALLGAWLYTPPGTKTSSGSEPASVVALDAVQRVLLAGKPTIIEFGANNCVSCREMKPVLLALAQDPRIAVADVDILKERGYISKYQIRLMPTQVFYNAQGEETGRHMGKISADDILAQLGMLEPGTVQNPATPKATL